MKRTLNEYADESVGAGKLLRSTVDGFITDSGYIDWYLRKWRGWSKDIDYDELAAECLIGLYTKEVGLEVKDRDDVFYAVNRQIQNARRSVFSGVYYTRHERRTTPISEMAIEGEEGDLLDITDTIVGSEEQPEIRDVDTYIEQIKKVNYTTGLIISLVMMGYKKKDIAHKFGVSKQAIDLRIKKIRGTSVGRHLKKIYNV